MVENEKRGRRGVDLSSFSSEQLREMQEKAGDTGYYKGIPFGSLTRELEERINPTRKVRKPKKRLGVDTSEPTQRNLIDQQMEARMGPNWGRR